MGPVHVQSQSPWCISLMPMLPLFYFPLALLFPLAYSMNPPLVAPLVQTTRQRNGWILKSQQFYFQPALLAFSTSHCPIQGSHPYASWSTFNLNWQLNSDHKLFWFLFLQDYVVCSFLSGWSLSFTMIGRRQPFPFLQPKDSPRHISLQPSVLHSHHHDLCIPLQVSSQTSTLWGMQHLQYYFSSS